MALKMFESPWGSQFSIHGYTLGGVPSIGNAERPVRRTFYTFVILNTYIYSGGAEALEFYDVSSEPL